MSVTSIVRQRLRLEIEDEDGTVTQSYLSSEFDRELRERDLRVTDSRSRIFGPVSVETQGKDGRRKYGLWVAEAEVEPT